MTESAEAIKDWLLKATERDGSRPALRSAYIVTIHGRKVLAAASGYTAHFSWHIPPALKGQAKPVNDVQVVDVGMGFNLGAAREWHTAESAFGFLVETFDFVTPIRVKTADFLRVTEQIRKAGAEGSKTESAAVKLVFQEMALRVSCLYPPINQLVPTEFDLMPSSFKIHTQSGYLLDAASIFRQERCLNLYIKSEPNMLGMGTVGDKFAVVMGMLMNEHEEQADAVRR